MATEFNNFFQAQPSRLGELPLVHTTSSEILDSLRENDSLTPKDCPVFVGEKLTYLFYGRPCFKPPPKDLPDATTRWEVAPICFVFRPSVTRHCTHRLHPCDTGAIHYKKFTGFIEKNERSAFEMEAKPEIAIRLVSFFYDTNQGYFDNAAPQTNDLTTAPASVVKYYNLLAKEGDSNFDERRSALEFQSVNSIPIKGNVLAVILPYSLLQRADIKTRIVEEWKSMPVGYKARRGSDPDVFYEELKDAVELALRIGGYL